MGNQLTIQNIVTYFASIAAQHGQIKSFYYGPKYDVSVTKEAIYPIMVVIPQKNKVRQDSIVLSHQIQILDQNQADVTNRVSVMSDNFQILLDIKAFIYKDFSTIGENIFPQPISEVEPFWETYDDNLAGWSLELDLAIDYIGDVCNIPNLYPSGVTFDSTGTYMTINLANYLPLAGGVLTGPVTGTSLDMSFYFSGGTPLIDIIEAIASGSTGVWTLGNGYESIVAINDSGLISRGSYAVAEGQTTSANAIATHAEGTGSIAGYPAILIDGASKTGSYIVNSQYGNLTGVINLGDLVLLNDYKYDYDFGAGTGQVLGVFWDGTNTLLQIATSFTTYNIAFLLADLTTDISNICNYSIGDNAHAEGNSSTASGYYSHSEGSQTTAQGNLSHAEGYYTTAQLDYSHTEGYGTAAIGTTETGGYGNHAEGYYTTSTGYVTHAEGEYTSADGEASHAEGSGSSALAYASHAEGGNTRVNPVASYGHAEGSSTVVNNFAGHAEGWNTQSLGFAAHSEGQQTIAQGSFSHAEGSTTTATGSGSHAEGYLTTASGNGSHAEGGDPTIPSGYGGNAQGNASHAGGISTIATGEASFVHGINSSANGISTVVFGENITGNNDNTVYVPFLNIGLIATSAIVAGLGIDIDGNVVSGSTGGGTFITGNTNVYISGNSTNTIDSNTNVYISGGTFITGLTITGGTYDNTDGTLTLEDSSGNTITITGFTTGGTNGTDVYWVSGSTGLFSVKANNDSGLNATQNYALAEGYGTLSNGFAAHAEGWSTTANNTAAHAEGFQTGAFGLYSHAEGNLSIAYNQDGHAEGYSTVSNGNYSHAEGNTTSAYGVGSHSEGQVTYAYGDGSHAEGQATQANGSNSHAEGAITLANSNESHAEGLSTQALETAAHAEGYGSIASGGGSHAEGGDPENNFNGGIASGLGSHAEGVLTTANGYASHAGGNTSVAGGNTSFVHGNNSQALGDSSIILGDNITGLTNHTTYVEQLSVGTGETNTCAIVTVSSNTQGVLMPRMNTSQKTSIGSPIGGLMVYDTDLNQMSYYNGSTWINI